MLTRPLYYGPYLSKQEIIAFEMTFVFLFLEVLVEVLRMVNSPLKSKQFSLAASTFLSLDLIESLLASIDDFTILVTEITFFE